MRVAPVLALVLLAACGAASSETLEAQPSALASVTVEVRNASAHPRTFNAGWATGVDTTAHATGWIVPCEVLAPGEVRAVQLQVPVGASLLLGVSGYTVSEPAAWARQELALTVELGARCTFTYSAAPMAKVRGACAGHVATTASP